MHIRKKDTVLVIAGKDKGKKGEVLRANTKNNTVVVSKVNIAKKHAKPTGTTPGGIKEIERPLPISKVMVICPKCGKPTRVSVAVSADGTKTRICKKCGEMVL
jgi:large subunit ribosomal protein L24